jgi:hypothetical protein
MHALFILYDILGELLTLWSFIFISYYGEGDKWQHWFLLYIHNAHLQVMGECNERTMVELFHNIVTK